MSELPIIQRSFDLIKWYVPILNNLPRDHKHLLGNRIITGMYELLEALIIAQYEHDKLARLQSLNSKLDILRYQTRLLFEFKLLPIQRLDYASAQIDSIGAELGGWIKQQRQRRSKT